MHLKSKSEIVLILIFSIASFQFAAAQDLVGTIELADYHFEKGQYTTALKHYQRVIYFSDDTLLQQSFLGVAQCHSQLNNVEKARQYYDLAYQNTMDDSLANKIMFEKAISNITNERYQYAQVDIFNIFPRNEQERDRMDFFMGITHYKMDQFDSAQVRFKKVLPPTDTLARHKIDSLFALNTKYQRLNPKTARIMSMIIPGSGQLYAGNVKEALNSFLITFGFGYLTYNTSVNISVIDGFVSVFPWFFRYYLGGYNNAAELTKEKINEREDEVLGSVLQVIRQSKALN